MCKTVMLTAAFAVALVASPASADPGQNAPVRPTQCRADWTFSYGGWLVGVGWTDRSSNEDGFTLERWRDGPDGWYLIETTVMGPNETRTFAAFAGARDKLRVRAFNSSGVSAWSNWAHVGYP